MLQFYYVWKASLCKNEERNWWQWYQHYWELTHVNTKTHTQHNRAWTKRHHYLSHIRTLSDHRLQVMVVLVQSWWAYSWNMVITKKPTHNHVWANKETYRSTQNYIHTFSATTERIGQSRLSNTCNNISYIINFWFCTNLSCKNSHSKLTINFQ